MACLGYADCDGRPHSTAQDNWLNWLNYGFEESLALFLAFCLANENAYTIPVKHRGGRRLPGPAGQEDFKIFKALFDYDIHDLAPAGMWNQLASYESSGKGSRVFNKRIEDRIVSLAVKLKSADVWRNSRITWRYEFGVVFGLNKTGRHWKKDEDDRCH